MPITDFNTETFVDLFGDGSNNQPAPTNTTPKFGSEEQNTDLFSTGDTTTIAPVEAGNPDSTTDSTTETTTQAGDNEPDILGEGKAKPGRKPKYDFEDAVGYFTDRVKNGKFVAIEET